jgi:hypothetical protein
LAPLKKDRRLPHSFLYLAIFKPQPCWWLDHRFYVAILCIMPIIGWGTKPGLFWAAHVTHHSSQYFNLSTGLRTNGIHLFIVLFFGHHYALGIPLK